jgi:CubicO group peptidase (beta-lactamase class C family)
MRVNFVDERICRTRALVGREGATGIWRSSRQVVVLEGSNRCNEVLAGCAWHVARVWCRVTGGMAALGRCAGAAAAVLLVVLAAACTTSSSQPAGRAANADVVCDEHGCVSVDRLARGIDAVLRDRVVGYVALVGRGPRVWASGQARTAVDPPALAMGADMAVNTASVGKMFTTIAVLQVLARRGLSVDTRIGPYLPADWVKGAGIDTVTFRELLTHRAGFRYDSGAVFTDEHAAQNQVRTGIRPEDKPVAEYNNIDFTIFRDVLPLLDGIADPGPARRTQAANTYFLNYVQHHVFDPVHVTDARCAAVTDAALFYPPPNDAGGVHGKQLPVGPSACAAGGWFISPASMLRILTGLLDTNNLLTAEQKALMNDDCLGWDCSVVSQNGFRAKDGYFDIPPAAMMVSFVIIKGSLPVVVVVNSPPGQDLHSVLVNAMNGATIH